MVDFDRARDLYYDEVEKAIQIELFSRKSTEFAEYADMTPDFIQL